MAEPTPLVQSKPNYPGIPLVVTPDIARWLRQHHPQYDTYATIIANRVEEWEAHNDPESAAYKKAERERAAAAKVHLASLKEAVEGGTATTDQVKEYEELTAPKSEDKTEQSQSDTADTAPATPAPAEFARPKSNPTKEASK